MFKVTYTKKTAGTFHVHVARRGAHSSSAKDDVFQTFTEAQAAAFFWLHELGAKGYQRKWAVENADHYEEISCGVSRSGLEVFSRHPVTPANWV